LPKAIMNLAGEILTNPVRIKVSEEKETIDIIKQTVYYVSKNSKIKLLIKLLNENEFKTILVFSRTKRGADDIAKELNLADIKSAVIHGDKAQGDRQKALRAFKNKEINILIATDIAARGIDVDEVSHVINYDLPETPDTYIHRIGRTGRAGNAGTAIAFCSPNQYPLLQDIEKHINMKIPMSKDKKLSLDPSKIVVAPRKNKSNNTGKSSNKNSKNSSSRKKSVNRKTESKSFDASRNKQRNRRTKK
jgi:ATP-dependent RNA helicase RhlE